MIQKNARLFAIGHFMIPIVLILLYHAQPPQSIIFVLAVISLLWGLYLCWRAFVHNDLNELLQRNVVWLIMGIDLTLIAAIYTLPTWPSTMRPIWLILFLVPFYVSELKFTHSLAFCLLGLVDIYLYSVFQQSSDFLSVYTVLIIVGMFIYLFMLGRSTRVLNQMAYYDPLTGIPNRESFQQRLKSAIQETKRKKEMLGLLFLDLDQFKHVNDTMGHVAGDELLQQISLRIRQCLPDKATLFRMGGDEFTLLIPHMDKEEDAALVTDIINKVLRTPIVVSDQEIFMTASIGIAIYPKDGSTSEILMKNADSAMYRAKELGRNNYQFYTAPCQDMPYDRLTMETMLRKALENDQIVVYYQPRIDARTEEIVAVEALARWNHPDLGLIPPKDFIPLAEDTDLILILGEQVLRKACQQVRKWHDDEFIPIRVSVNVSPRQLKQANLPEIIANVLQDTGLDPSFLELEITESAAMQNVNFAILMLRELKDMNVTISIDDFGVGYSSLSYLKKLPIDALKIDQSFMRGIEQDIDNAAIVSAIIALAQRLGLHVTAEGVESKRQLQFLQSQDCDEVQGFLFGKPMPAHTFEEWMHLRNKVPDLIL